MADPVRSVCCSPVSDSARRSHELNNSGSPSLNLSSAAARTFATSVLRDSTLWSLKSEGANLVHTTHDVGVSSLPEYLKEDLSYLEEQETTRTDVVTETSSSAEVNLPRSLLMSPVLTGLFFHADDEDASGDKDADIDPIDDLELPMAFSGSLEGSELMRRLSEMCPEAATPIRPNRPGGDTLCFQCATDGRLNQKGCRSIGDRFLTSLNFSPQNDSKHLEFDFSFLNSQRRKNSDILDDKTYRSSTGDKDKEISGDKDNGAVDEVLENKKTTTKDVNNQDLKTLLSEITDSSFLSVDRPPNNYQNSYPSCLQVSATARFRCSPLPKSTIPSDFENEYCSAPANEIFKMAMDHPFHQLGSKTGTDNYPSVDIFDSDAADDRATRPETREDDARLSRIETIDKKLPRQRQEELMLEFPIASIKSLGSHDNSGTQNSPSANSQTINNNNKNDNYEFLLDNNNREIINIQNKNNNSSPDTSTRVPPVSPRVSRDDNQMFSGDTLSLLKEEFKKDTNGNSVTKDQSTRLHEEFNIYNLDMETYCREIEKSLFVSIYGLQAGYEFDADDITQVFMRYGDVIAVEILPPSNNTALVRLDSVEACNLAIAALHQQNLQNISGCLSIVSLKSWLKWMQTSAAGLNNTHHHFDQSSYMLTSQVIDRNPFESYDSDFNTSEFQMASKSQMLPRPHGRSTSASLQSQKSSCSPMAIVFENNNNRIGNKFHSAIDYNTNVDLDYSPHGQSSRHSRNEHSIYQQICEGGLPSAIEFENVQNQSDQNVGETLGFRRANTSLGPQTENGLPKFGRDDFVKNPNKILSSQGYRESWLAHDDFSNLQGSDLDNRVDSIFSPSVKSRNSIPIDQNNDIELIQRHKHNISRGNNNSGDNFYSGDVLNSSPIRHVALALSQENSQSPMGRQRHSVNDAKEMINNNNEVSPDVFNDENTNLLNDVISQAESLLPTLTTGHAGLSSSSLGLLSDTGVSMNNSYNPNGCRQDSAADRMRKESKRIFSQRNGKAQRELQKSRGSNFGNNCSSRREHNNTNGIRKWTIRYEIQIDPSETFQVTRRIIGSKGANMKRIFNLTNSKLRLRGQGSGYLEGAQRLEADDLLHLCISSGDSDSFTSSKRLVEELLKKVYAEYDQWRINEMQIGAANLKIKCKEIFLPSKSTLGGDLYGVNESSSRRDWNANCRRDSLTGGGEKGNGKTRSRNEWGRMASENRKGRR